MRLIIITRSNVPVYTDDKTGLYWKDGKPLLPEEISGLLAIAQLDALPSTAKRLALSSKIAAIAAIVDE